ncbi:photoreceptor cilium actin regulator [Tenrec ecaudatus]|uniref:photoreceptor cilium actin regulator n=1 Tax=Tenrec ecaudatus TaxID=94439 RepID=UPI003F5AD522
MGCTPSHSDIVNSVVKSGIPFLKKPKAILPGCQVGQERCSVPLLLKSTPDCSSGGGGAQGQRPAEEHPRCRWSPATAGGLCQLTRGPASGNRNAMEGLILDATTSPPRPSKSQSHKAKDLLAQSPHGSQGANFSVEAYEGWAVQETSPLEGLGTQGHGCQTSLPPCGSAGKVDFPELLIRAHHHCYTYLHSSLAKYEAILGISHQAAQTQELLQLMLRFLLLCLEEANRLLGEIAKDGEVLLREVGADLAWPLGEEVPPEQPDLLQQLLQYTVRKLQALEGTVGSLTSSLLEAASTCFRSSSSHLEKKLSVKRGVGEHLVRVLGQLESLASGHGDSGVQGAPLCSEDSGIGADNESVRSLDKAGKQGSSNLVLEPMARKPVEAGPTGRAWQPGPSWLGSDSPQDCPLMRLPTAKIQPSGSHCPDAGPERIPSPHLGTNESSLGDSLRTEVSVEARLPKGSRWMAPPSLGEDPDSSQEEEEEEEEEEEGGGAVSCRGPYTCQDPAVFPRPRSSPAGRKSTFQPHFRGLRGPQAQELILKMKKAISERIKFVPVPSGTWDWAEEEERRLEVPLRPSTVSGSRRVLGRQRRTQSEASLKNHMEDPTLQELWKVQRDLSQKLEAFYARGAPCQRLSRKQLPGAGVAASWPGVNRQVALSTTTSKLKASLTENFSILPSQDKSMLQKSSRPPVAQQPQQGTAKQHTNTTPSGEKAIGAPQAEDCHTRSHPPRTSVRKLIETFSPSDSLGALGDCKHSEPKPCLGKWGIPIMPPRFPIYRGLAPLYPKPRISPAAGAYALDVGTDWGPFTPILAPDPSGGQGLEDEMEQDPEQLPPPPLEILMDQSFATLETPESSAPGGASPGRTCVPALGGGGPAKKAWASPKLRASMKPMVLLPSKGTVSPTRPRSMGTGNSERGCSPRKSTLDSTHPPATSQNPEEEGGGPSQALTEKATGVSKQPRKASPWHHSSHISGQNRISEPGLARSTRGPPSPEASRQNQERSPLMARKAPPTRVHWVSQVEKRHSNLPSSHRPAQPSLPAVHRSPSPPLSTGALSPTGSPRVLSPPTGTKQVSPSPQLVPPSPPPESPPAQHKVSSPAPQSREGSSASSGPSPSPPASPAQGHKETRDSEDSPTAKAKLPGNTCSIFCPASASLFEAKSLFSRDHPLAPPSQTPEAGGSLRMPAGCWRSSLGPRLRADSQRRVALCALNPLPFVRRTASERRPGPRLWLPASGCPGAAAHDALLSPRSSSEENTRKGGEPWSSPCGSELKQKQASHPELCVLGHGLQREGKHPLDVQPQQEEAT